MIELDGIRFGYERAAPVLDGCDLRLASGLVLLVGPNGAGKSTLLRLAAGVEAPHAGRIRVDGRDLWREEVAARRRLAFVPEHPDLTPYASVGEVLTLVARLRSAGDAAAREALEWVGLTALAHRSVRELSMGQRRRAVLAAALIATPRNVLLDEPLEAMDRAVRGRVIEWVAGLATGDRLVVVATHQLEPFLPMAGSAYTIREGRAVGVASLPDDPDARLGLVSRLAAGRHLAG